MSTVIKLPELKLWDVQIPWYDEVRAAFTKAGGGHTRVLCQAPTGFGKTTVFTKIVAGAAARGETVYIVAHTNNILDQISQRLKDYGIEHSFIAAGYTYVPWRKVQLCMVQTLKGKVASGAVKKPRLVVIDEAHHSPAANYDCIFAWEDVHIVGVTATPERCDGIAMSTRYTKLIEGPSIRLLYTQVNPATSRPYLVKPWVYTPSRVDISQVRVNKKTGELNEDDCAQAIKNSKVMGETVALYKEHCPGKTAVVFCQTVEHCLIVEENFTKAGIAAKAIYGDQGKACVARILSDYEKGKYKVLISCMLVGEGFDLPKIEAVFLLRLTKSLVLFMQPVGRGLRADIGKDMCFVFDQVGLVDIHGLPHAPRKWSLDGRAELIDDGDAQRKQCKKCFLWIKMSAKVCKACGTECGGGGGKQKEYGENKFGKLVLVEDDNLEPIKPKREAAKSTRGEIGKAVAMAESLDELTKWATDKGYAKPGQWAVIQWGMKTRRQFKSKGGKKKYG